MNIEKMMSCKQNSNDFMLSYLCVTASMRMGGILLAEKKLSEVRRYVGKDAGQVGGRWVSTWKGGRCAVWSRSASVEKETHV